MSEFLDRMKACAKADRKTIVLPEGEDPRTIAAAEKIVAEGLANLVTPRSSPSSARRRASRSSRRASRWMTPPTSAP